MKNGIAPVASALENYERIIPTAWLTAYPKTFSDIPLSEDIFHELEQIRKHHGKPEVSQDLKVPKLAPEIEARYKLVTKLLYLTKIPQILEIAAGLCPRGMLMAKDPSIEYVEMDLPEMIAEKKEIIAKLAAASKVTLTHHLHLEEGSALEMNDLLRATRHFKKRPIAVVNEGLLRYLNFDEKAVVAKNVRALLERFGGVWITPDITLKKLLETQERITMPGLSTKIIGMTGKNFNENRFENEEQAKAFFEGFGFTVERHSFLEIEEKLTSPKKLQLRKEEVAEMIKSSAVFVMKL